MGTLSCSGMIVNIGSPLNELQLCFRTELRVLLAMISV